MATTNPRSRYFDAPPRIVILSNKRPAPAVYGPQEVSGSQVYSHVTARYGTRFDSLAAASTGNTRDWWQVAYLNPEILDPFSIEAGMTLRVPLR